MTYDKDFTERIKAWLESPRGSRNIEDGALLLLKMTGNQVMYRNIVINPSDKEEFLEYQLQKFFNFRVQQLTHEQVEEMAQKVETIAQKRLSYTDDNPASEFQAGRRADHDRLPEEIQAAYVENKSIVQRMRQVHTELKLLSTREGVCPDSDRYPFLKELIALDEQLHANWKKYDEWSTTENAPISVEDAREESKRASAFVNFNKGKYAENPSEELKQQLLTAYAKVINPSEKMTASLKKLGIIE